jgi:hypothetical protein
MPSRLSRHGLKQGEAFFHRQTLKGISDISRMLLR